MSTVKKYSRQLIVLFVVLATALTCVFAFIPRADAAENGNYTVRLKMVVTTYSDQLENVSATLNYKTNNGYGSAGTVTFSHSDIYSGVNSQNGVTNYTASKTVSGFPTSLSVSSTVKGEDKTNASTRYFNTTFTVQVLDANGSWVDLGSGTAHSNEATKSNVTKSTSYNVPTDKNPAISKTVFLVDGTQATSATVKVGTSHTYAAKAYDQYGVRWLSGISSANWSDNSELTSTSNDEKTVTVSFNGTNGGTDYSRTLNVAWNNSSVTASLPVTVYAPHTLTIDTNGGSYSGTNPVTGKYTNETASLSTPTRGGYSFSSWTKTAGNGSVSGNTFTFGNNNATVKANWSVVGYTISPVNGEDVYTAVDYNVESTSITLPTLSKTGYTFNGWVVSAADGNWSVGEKVTSNPSGKYGNITVSPSWTANTYTLNFNANNANAQVGTASKTVAYESKIGTLPTPTLTAYDFTGWFTDATAGSQVTADTVYTIIGNSTVYAHWTPTVYTISFNTDGGSAVSNITYNVENSSVTLPVTEKTGYTFSHWVVESQNGNWTIGNVANGTLASNYGDVVLKAVYTANNYNVELNLNTPAGAVTEPSCEKDSVTATFNAAIGTLPVPTLDGYEFRGWYSSATGGAQYTADTVYSWAENSTWYAVWTPVTYTIITDANGGSEVADVTYTIENGTIPAGGELEGFWFSHWEVAEGSGNWEKGTTFNAGDSTVGMYGNVTLKAVWAPKEYTVTFDLNDTTGVGAATADKESITATFNQPLDYNEALPVVTRNGYTFLGWFTADGEEVTADMIYDIEGSTTYYAHWEVVEYTITFDVNYGDALASVTYTIEDELVLPVATKTGSTFTSWFYNQVTTGSWKRNATYYADSLNLGTGNWGSVTLKANYTVNEYKITWIINGAEESTMHKYNTVPSHADPVITDDPYYSYEFIGWSPVIGIVTGEATYTAMFEKLPKVYTVTWVDGEGNTVYSTGVEYGAVIPTDVDVPEKTGYTVEWNYEGITTMPAGNLTIKAVYTPIKYAIHWESEGVVIGTDMVDYDSLPSYTGATPEKAETPEYSYVFKGWTPSIVPVTGETTYVAEFTAVPQEYTITFVADDVTVMSYKLAFGSAITVIPDVPEKIGSVGAWQGIPTTMPANDVTIVAKYVKGALVTWYLDGTTDGASYQLGFENGEQIDYDREDPVKPADAEYTYTFEGWSTTPGGALISGYPVASETDLVYYAVYSKTANVYTITWKADGNVVLTEELAFGSAVSNIPGVPDKTGHTGVWKNIPSTMPATDVTVNAEYTPNDYTITWVVGDDVYGTIFQYGTTPKFTGVTHKPSTATTDFTFVGWDKDITTVAGDETYTAVYAESARKYTVTWKYEDGTVIDTDSVANGAAITYIPAIAYKEGHDPVYVIPEVMPTENVTIVVTYEAKSYTIKWSTPAGIIEETWKYGETPVYDTDKYGVPVKDATAEKQFTFSGWSPVVGTVTGEETYVATFSEAARKYTVIWYVDGEFYDTSDVACGSNIPTRQVPEKTGYTGIWDNPYRTMPARDLEINAVYTAKKYTVYWKVDGLTVYSASVSYGAAIPSQKVPEKTGCTGVWVNVPETMPAENITINAEYTAKQFNVSWRMDGVTTTTTATYGIDYIQTFEEGKRPEELKITIAGVVVGEDSYIYNAETGELRILGNSIIGDIMIVARAAGGNCNLIANLFGGTSSNDVELIPERTAYFTQLVPAEGYLLPTEVMVYVDGIYMNSGYTYDKTTGKLILNAEIVVGEIEIYAEFPENPNYNPGTGEEGGNVDSSDCNCDCHSTSAFTKFFFKILTFFRKLFGMKEYQYCGCGAAHW